MDSDTADIYFTEEYSRLYEEIENGETVVFRMDCPCGSVEHMFLRRPVPRKIDGVQYYDAVTAYGYGGPRILSLAPHEDRSQVLKELLLCFRQQYRQFCRENRIISEFVRFHPLLGNGSVFGELFSARPIRQTVGTDLRQYPDFFREEYSKRCRKKIRHCLRQGVTVEVIQGPEDLQAFIEIYEATMKRNHAPQFYHFSRDYFDRLLGDFRDHILLVKAMYQGRMIAGALDFIWGDVVTVHLSGTLDQYLHLSPAYLLRWGVTVWAKEHGCSLIHHGGGRSNDPQDSLYLFKKQFGENTSFPFYVGRKIWDPEIYVKLSAGREDQAYFPAYRGK